MKRAELQIDDEDPRLWFRAYDVPRQLQRVDRGIAAHETYHRALDRTRKSAPRDQLVIETGRRESGTGRDQQMRDTASFAVEFQALDGSACERRSTRLERAHARRRIWKISAGVESLDIDCRPARIGCRRQGRVAVFNARSFRHAPEHGAAPVVSEQRLGEAQECLMDVGGRHRRRDPIDMRCRHSSPLAATARSSSTFNPWTEWHWQNKHSRARQYSRARWRQFQMNVIECLRRAKILSIAAKTVTPTRRVQILTQKLGLHGRPCGFFI